MSTIYVQLNRQCSAGRGQWLKVNDVITLDQAKNLKLPESVYEEVHVEPPADGEKPKATKSRAKKKVKAEAVAEVKLDEDPATEKEAEVNAPV